GLTKDKDTEDFSLVLDVIDFNLQEYLIKNNSIIGWKERCQIPYKISHYDITMDNKIKISYVDPEMFINIQIHFPENISSGEGPGNFIKTQIHFSENVSSRESPRNFIRAEIQFSENLSSGEDPGNFIRAEIQFPENLSSRESPENFLKSRIYFFQDLTELTLAYNRVAYKWNSTKIIEAN
ncbi:22002_t:CDS:2, partial [Racocetra persica]